MKDLCPVCKEMRFAKDVRFTGASCRLCYNKHKREYYQNTKKLITCPVCKIDIISWNGRHHRNTQKHQSHLTPDNYDLLTQEEKSLLLLYF